MARLWLTRMHDGRYMLTAFRPVIATVKGTDFQDVYERHGEPIGVRHLCPLGVKTIFGVELKPLESVRVLVDARVDNAPDKGEEDK